MTRKLSAFMVPRNRPQCLHTQTLLGQKSPDTQVVCLHGATQPPSMLAHTHHFRSEITRHASCLPSQGHATALNTFFLFFGQKSSLFWSEIMSHTSCLPSWCQATTLNACTHKPHLFGLKSCHTQAACLPGAKQPPSMPAHTNHICLVWNHVTHKRPAFLVPCAIIIHSFYIALFSALKHTAHISMWFWMSDCILL